MIKDKTDFTLLVIGVLISICLLASCSSSTMGKIATGGNYKSSYGRIYPIYYDTLDVKYYFERTKGKWFEIISKKNK